MICMYIIKGMILSKKIISEIENKLIFYWEKCFYNKELFYLFNTNLKFYFEYFISINK